MTLVELEQEAVVYDPRSRLVHYMNPMASLVLQLCDGTSTVRETISELALAQEVEPDAIAPSVRSLMRGFRKFGLVTPSRGAERLPAVSDSANSDREMVRREVPRSD